MGQANGNSVISGKLSIDDSWDSKIYISYIPTYDDMYLMSNEMIVAETYIDSLGYFEFKIDYLPKGENLYRLHLAKKGDTRATLIIGGKDENHLFFILNHPSKVDFTSLSTYPPFKKIIYKNSGVNNAFQQISDMVFISDSIASGSTATKRLLIEKQLQNDLLSIADTSSNFLVGLYAIYKSKFESNYQSNADFYDSYVNKWQNEDNTYLSSFVRKFPKRSNSIFIFLIVVFTITIAVIGLFLGRLWLDPNRNIKKLSIQERKVFELLKQGDTNQEIANGLNIGLSTVKSHVSSIYSKLNIKSRKEITSIK
ncbi:response regulator transcription factor [Carboxylicivirga sp. N1Y90]|uniref:response regulator transcription factor n=1 Tax=Carboxylicivirga fragile TaxID=3417571 RepID=UPI003D331D7F|nr:response regulator transcription factor [Marinilabiliaceae bacterium N1Y90]